MVLLGILFGLLSVTGKETRFLVAAVALLMVLSFFRDYVVGELFYFMEWHVAEDLWDIILADIATFVVGAVVVVALKSLKSIYL